MYKIKEPYTSTMYIRKPVTIKVKGVPEKTYTPCASSNKISCLFKTYGGTVHTSSSEKNVNGVIAVIDTATIETWYNEEITADCMLSFDDNNNYEILGSPENIGKRNQTMIIKVKKVVGGA